MPGPLTASVRKAAAANTSEFDWLLGEKPFFTFKDIAGRLGISDSLLERLWDDKANPQHISGHRYNAGEGKRFTTRIARPFAVRLLVQSADYTTDEKVNAMISCAADFNAAECLKIAAAFNAEARRKGL